MYILWSTNPPSGWICARQEKKTGFLSFFIFSSYIVPSHLFFNFFVFGPILVKQSLSHFSLISCTDVYVCVMTTTYHTLKLCNQFVGTITFTKQKIQTPFAALHSNDRRVSWQYMNSIYNELEYSEITDCGVALDLFSSLDLVYQCKFVYHIIHKTIQLCSTLHYKYPPSHEQKNSNPTSEVVIYKLCNNKHSPFPERISYVTWQWHSAAQEMLVVYKQSSFLKVFLVLNILLLRTCWLFISNPPSKSIPCSKYFN